MKQSEKQYRVKINGEIFDFNFGSDRVWAQLFVEQYGIPDTKLELIEI